MKKLLLFFISAWALAVSAIAQQLPSLIPYLDGHQWGYADTNGHVMINPQWRYVDFFKNGRAHVGTENSNCIINEHGAYIIPPYRHWEGKFYSSVVGAYYNARGKDGKYGIIDSNNHELLPCIYDKKEFGNGFTNSGYFTWNKSLKKYAAKVCKNGKFGLIDTLNHVLIPFEYDGIAVDDGFPFSSSKYYVAQKDEKDGVIDAHNRVIIPFQYRNIWLDELDSNQIKLFKERTSVIADTNGNITWEIPGYELEFPRNSLIPVRDSTYQYGLMNYNRQLVIPCQYLGVWQQHDTIVISQWFTDPGKGKAQYFKYLDIHTYKEISGWLNHQQHARIPDKVPSPVLNNKLPHYTKMRIQGKDLDEYKKDNILWAASAYAKVPEYLIPVRGIATNDSVARYAAIIDSNGNYVVAPLVTNNKLKVINAADSLVTIETSNKDSFQSVADFQLRTVLPFQQYAIAGAFYYDHTFYAVATHDYQYEYYWSNFEGGGRSQAHEYTYFLVDANGKPAKGMERYRLHSYTDSAGYSMKTKRYSFDDEDEFNAPFIGWFMAEDSLGKRGVVNIYGQVLLSALSFKYGQFYRIGPDVFQVDNPLPRQYRYYENDWVTDKDKNKTDEKKLLRGLPYLVNRNNKVLLDSLSIEYAYNTAASGAAPLYYVGLKRRENQSYEDIRFYMDNKGRAYHGNLKGDKIEVKQKAKTSTNKKTIKKI